MRVDTSTTWNEHTRIVRTNLTGPVTADDVERWRDDLYRTIAMIPEGGSFRLLFNARQLDPVDIATHKAMRTVVPLLLAAHGMRPAYVDLFDDNPEVTVTTSRGVTCSAFANVHHDVDKMEDFQRRIGKPNQIFLTDLAQAEAWLLAFDNHPEARSPRTPSDTAVVALYDGTAESYARMMDEEIKLPVYSETLARLSQSIRAMPGPVVDTSCGPGHMLWLYRERYDPQRTVVGVDLSPSMVAIARSRLGQDTQVLVGDMRRLTTLTSGSVAGVISFFAIHHLDHEQVKDCFTEWHRVLRVGGRLVLAAWEGSGLIDYGDVSDAIAYKHAQEQLSAWLGECGFQVDQCRVEAIEEMGMHAVYLDATSV